MTITLPNCPIHTYIDKHTYQETNNNVANLMICFVYEIDKIWPKYIILNNVKSTIFHKKKFQSCSQGTTLLSPNFTIDDIIFIMHRSQQVRLIVSKRSENNIVPLT